MATTRTLTIEIVRARGLTPRVAYTVSIKNDANMHHPATRVNHTESRRFNDTKTASIRACSMVASMAVDTQRLDWVTACLTCARRGTCISIRFANAARPAFNRRKEPVSAVAHPLNGQPEFLVTDDCFDEGFGFAMHFDSQSGLLQYVSRATVS